LIDLFQLWRAELAVSPIPDPPPVRRVSEVVVKGSLPRRRALRPALSIAAAIAMLLAGSATVAAKSADPGDILWPITEMVWPARVQSVQSVQEVRAALEQARSALDDGRPQDAQLALLNAAVQLGSVDEADGRADMANAVNDLWAAAAPGESLAGGALQIEPKSSSPAPSVTIGSTPAVVNPVTGALVPLVPAAPLVPGSTVPTIAQAGGAPWPVVGGAGPVGAGPVSPETLQAGAGSNPAGSAPALGAEVVTAAAPVAMPTPVPPVEDENSALPTSPAVATEQSSPTPSQTTPPTETSPTEGVDSTDGRTQPANPLALDGSGSSAESVTPDAGNPAADVVPAN
jgi:hypothetical protein